MKKILLLVAAMVIAVSSFAQEGGKWETGTFQDALNKAKNNKKGPNLVFMDCYTTWCGPCKHIAEVKARLDAAVRDASTGVISNEFVAQYIDKIFVTLTDDDTAKLEIKIFTGKSTEKWLKKLNARSRSRTGVTSKKMIQSYENGLAGKNQNQ